MEPVDQVTARRQELVELAHLMLDGQFNLIEGVRRICALRLATGDPDNEVFFPIWAVESETDAFPLGEMRAACSPDYLKRSDAEMQRYLDESRSDILKACREILRAFS